MIREFQKTDAQQCSNLITDCINNSPDLSKENKQFMLNSSQPENIVKKSKNRSLYVFETNKEILGTGAISGSEIRTMFVGPNIQRKGIGKRMLNFLTNRAKDQGIKKLWLKSSPQAEGFYKKQGFKKTRIRNDFNHKTIQMEKELK